MRATFNDQELADYLGQPQEHREVLRTDGTQGQHCLLEQLGCWAGMGLHFGPPGAVTVSCSEQRW